MVLRIGDIRFCFCGGQEETFLSVSEKYPSKLRIAEKLTLRCIPRLKDEDSSCSHFVFQAGVKLAPDPLAGVTQPSPEAVNRADTVTV